MAPFASLQFDAFRELVLATPDLQRQLRSEFDHHRFVALVVDLGAAHGFVFNAADVRDSMAENRRTWWASQRL